MSGFLQVWECPKCRERRSTFRMGKSEGRIVPTYCGPSCGMVKVAVERYKPQPSAEERLAAENEALKKEVAGWDESMSLLASEATRVAAELRAELAQARQRIARLEEIVAEADTLRGETICPCHPSCDTTDAELCDTCLAKDAYDLARARLKA